MPAGTKTRDAIASKEVLILFHDNLDALKRSFDKFAASESENGTISLSEFSEFATRAGFTGGGSRMGLQKSWAFERNHSIIVITGDETRDI
ncbi:hypothetical protein ACHAXM_005010 [Skeletonema potamos]